MKNCYFNYVCHQEGLFEFTMQFKTFFSTIDVKIRYPVIIVTSDNE
jgi:hypothetical protein